MFWHNSRKFNLATGEKADATCSPSPAAVAWATRITEAEFFDVYQLALRIDEVAQEARRNERNRIFSMSAKELFAEFWSGRQLRRKQYGK